MRTKHVTSDNIPTLEHVKGLALWGPGASLFTLGPNCTVQQFDLNSPAIMVANVQHPVNLLPPSPPNSNEENAKSVHSSTTIHTSESETSSVPIDMAVSESDEDHMSPFDRIALRGAPSDSGNEMPYETTSSLSSRSGQSMESTGSKTPGRYPSSLRSKGLTENTYISAGTSLQSSTVGRQRREQERELDNYSMGYTIGSTSVSSISTTSRSRQRPSRLRNEVPRSPDDDKKVHELFKYTRSRLSDLAYKHPVGADKSRLTNDDLRRQMLSTIFGWHKEVEDLVYDEMSRHPNGSTSRILLAKWLGDMDGDILAASSENMTSSDWMLLALSGIGGQTSQQKLGRTYVQRLLETGDIHVAVTIMLGMGDHNDAIEVYISHRRYMEALILTCLTFPSVWERQAAIVRKWGEWAVKHGQQQLAIRCFACTEKESTETWTSPSATQLNFQSIGPSIPEVLSPPLSPPGLQRGPQRSIAKTSALKLITSFDNPGSKSKFYNQHDDGQTPIAGGPTPIAESAVSPGGYDQATAFLRPSNNSRFNTPTSARPSGPSFGRGRLPSIGEMPSDLSREALKAQQAAERPHDRKMHSRKSSVEQDTMSVGISLQRAQTASPMMMRDGYQPMLRGFERERDVEGDRPPSPTQNFLTKVQDIRRNGSRGRIPQGLKLNLELQPETFGPSAHQMENVSPEQSGASSAKFHWPSRRRGPGSVASSVTSASSAGRRNHGSNRHQRDDHIYSLDTAQKHSKKPRDRHTSRDRTPRNASRGREASRERRTAKSREASEDRGRAADRKWHQAKRSPTSPVPMSPEDIANMGTPRFAESEAPSTVRKMSSSHKSKQPKSRNSSRGSRRQSPERGHHPPALEIDVRGRSKGRDGSVIRSPSSPVPLSATTPHYQDSEDEEDYQKAVQAQELFRARHNKSASHGLNSPALNRRERSSSRPGDVRDVPPPILSHARATSTEHAGDLRRMKEERQRKKEAAARELEDRRKSLAQRAHTPGMHHPSSYSPGFPRIGVESTDSAHPEDVPPRCATEPPRSMYASRNGPHIGLPATPKAMRLRMESDTSYGSDRGSQSQSGYQPEVPPIPASFSHRQSPKASPGPSPKKEDPEPKESKGEESLLTLLPSTVYQPPSRPMIPRSMSAPIPDEPSPRLRKGSVGGLRGIDEVVTPRRRSQEEPPMPPPPPPPPAPALLKELQHLAKPPPPPPAPLPHARRPQESSALSSGMIEIVMDEDEENNDPPAAAPMDGIVPVLAAPAPPSKGHSRGHSRGRSQGDTGSISGRLSKATERLRSASRGRKDGMRGGHMKSPPMPEAPYESIPTHHLKSQPQSMGGESPYESIPSHYYKPSATPVTATAVPPPVFHDPDVIRSPIEGPKRSHMSTGLHYSEMI